MPDRPNRRFSDIFTQPVDPGPSMSRANTVDYLGDLVNDPHQAVGTHIPKDVQPRFDGDTSGMPAEACWALQALVTAAYVDTDTKTHWSAVLHYEQQLRSRLSELGLVLHIDHDREYAFTRQADDPSPHSRKVLRAKTLKFAPSVLALHLYQRYVTSPDDPIVDTDEMVDHMMTYKPADDTDEAGFRKKALTAIKALDDAAILKPIKDTNRYRIHGVITAVLTADQIEALQARYAAIGSDITSDSEADNDDD